MSKFQVGERVVFYEGGVKYKGTIYLDINTVDHCYGIKTDCDTNRYIHEKQIRRLVKKKPKRTFWVNVYQPSNKTDTGLDTFYTKEMADEKSFPECLECIEVVEVRKK